MKPVFLFTKIIWGTLIALLLTSCADQSHIRPDSPMIAESNAGRVIVSLTHISPRIGIFSTKFSFSPAGASSPVYGINYYSRDVRGNPQTHRITIEENDLLGEVALIELPSGKYVVNNWAISLSQFTDFFGYVELTSEKYNPIAFSFTVEPGKTTYIGNLHLNIHSKTSITHELRDMQERDLSLLAKKHTRIEIADIENRLMVKGE